MRKHSRSLSHRGLAHLAVPLLLAGFASVSFAGDIKLDNNQIPKPPGQLKRLKLSKATPPNVVMQKVLGNAHPGGKFEPLAQSEFAKKHGIRANKDVQAVIKKDHVVASVDGAKGHVDIMPDLDELPPITKVTDFKTHPALPAQAADRAKKAADETMRQGFPPDATRPALDEMLTLVTAQYNKGAQAGQDTLNPDRSGPILATFPVKRLVGDLPVFGRGSRGQISVDGEGKVKGFKKHWKHARNHDTVTETRSQAEIAGLIRGQLADLATKADIVVQDVELGYYDGDEEYIQPVYQFRAKVTHTAGPSSTGKVTDDDYIAGYIPIGSVLEPIPSVNELVGGGPNVPQGAPTNLPVSEFMPTEPPVQMAAAQEIPPGDPTVGRYVVRNDYVGWVNSANNFWNGLQASGYGGYFTNSQYYWAYPFETGSSKNSYVNSVHVALMEVHGNWWEWTTYWNCCEWGSLDDVPYPGFGSSAGGVLAYWIIHSCQVVPSAADTVSWPDKWWHVFGGLHSVLGYRTVMYIDDGAMWPFGIHMGWGWGLVNAWLNDVSSSPLYWFRPGEVMHGVWKPYGRPSTISVCGHENDSVYYVAGVGRAGCLQNYWYW